MTLEALADVGLGSAPRGGGHRRRGAIVLADRAAAQQLDPALM